MECFPRKRTKNSIENDSLLGNFIMKNSCDCGKATSKRHPAAITKAMQLKINKTS